MQPIMWMKMLVIVSTGTVHAVSAAASQASNWLAAFTDTPYLIRALPDEPGLQVLRQQYGPPGATGRLLARL